MGMRIGSVVRRGMLVLLVVLVGAGGVAYVKLRQAGQTQVEGDMKLAGLSAPVKVLRDQL
jgi:hypothetical protein